MKKTDEEKWMTEEAEREIKEWRERRMAWLKKELATFKSKYWEVLKALRDR